MIAVADAGPLIALGKLGRLDLLHSVAEAVLVPPAVFSEVVVEGENRGRSDALAVRRALRGGILRLVESEPIKLVPEIEALPLGLGELETIQIALDRHADAVLLDDLLARRAAAQQGLMAVGTLGVVVRAYRTRDIDRDAVAEIFSAIRRRPDIWISAELVDGTRAALEDSDSPLE